MKNRTLLHACLLISGFALVAQTGCVYRQSASTNVALSSDWWPVQKSADSYITVTNPPTFGEQVLLQSLAGLAAKMVNDGRGHELVWMEGSPSVFNDWKQRTIDRLTISNSGSCDVWELLNRYKAMGFVNGYILYSVNNGCSDADVSVNVATTMAGIMGAVPVDEANEGRASASGLKKLADARGMSMQESFDRFHKQCNSNIVCQFSYNNPCMRDLAVGHTAFAGYGTNSVTQMSLELATPLAPVIGWGQGDEFKHTAPITRSGHFHTVSDWGRNITMLSADSAAYRPRPLKALDPRSIEWADKRSCVAFMMSDGDNLGYMTSGFWGSSYWGHPEHGAFPVGFSACLADLVQSAPVVVDKISETKPEQTSVIQFSGGYFYPDLFGADRTNRMDLLRIHARRINVQMQRTGAQIMCCIMEKSDSPTAQDALRVFAEEIHPLLGIMVMDYAPYHRMEGKVYWVADGQGNLVPAVTARYAMWAGMNRRGGGGPEDVARQISSDTGGVMDPVDSWVAAHAWSQFLNPETGLNESGLNPVHRCIKLLDNNLVHVVSPEEMFWRLRMRHDPVATSAMMN